MTSPSVEIVPLARRGWFVMLVCGAAWGLAMGLIEALRQPPVGMPARRMAEFVGLMATSWSINGVVWGMTAWLAGRRPTARRMLFAWAACAIIASTFTAVMNVNHTVLTLGLGMWAVLGRHIPFDAALTHTLWWNAVFGGLYMGGYWAFLRALRSRRQLARVQLALSEEASLLHEARLASLRGVMRPQVLIDAVGVLRTRYETDPTAADALLDRLVTYLRAATGGRGGSALASDAYRDLHAALSDPSNVPQPLTPGAVP
jgi:hypothetical protein